jgi:hypothetical protein
MLVRRGDHTDLEARAKAEPVDSVVTSDYYTQLPQIRLSANPTSRETLPAIPIEVTLDDTDVAKLVECAIRHPVLNMRQAVLAAIWNHSDSFRQIFQFGLQAPVIGGDPVRWLWIVPITERDRQLAKERGSATLVSRLAAQHRSWIVGP